MALASRYAGAAALSRLVVAHRPLAIRSFSTSPRALQDSSSSSSSSSSASSKNRFADAPASASTPAPAPAPAPAAEPVRRSPLIGNYVPARPVKSTDGPHPASTEKPRATSMPSPSKAPASSAEVAPNAEMPPPPPPPPPPQSRGSVSPSSTTTPGRPGKPGASRGSYDATAAAQSPGYIDLARLLDNSANRYAKENNLPASPADQPLVRTRPVTGRTVFPRLNAQGGDLSDPQLLFNNLNKMLARQKVKHLMHRQKFHERPGVKRKRLVMERWRRRFKVGFKATASRVMDLKRQGW